MADYLSGLIPADQLGSSPLKGKKIGLIRETVGEGVSAGVNAAVQAAIKQLEQLGAVVEEVSGFCHIWTNLQKVRLYGRPYAILFCYELGSGRRMD